jgi:hypothetical protein
VNLGRHLGGKASGLKSRGVGSIHGAHRFQPAIIQGRYGAWTHFFGTKHLHGF